MRNIPIESVTSELRDNGFVILKNVIPVSLISSAVGYLESMDLASLSGRSARGHIVAGSPNTIGWSNTKSSFYMRFCCYPWNMFPDSSLYRLYSRVHTVRNYILRKSPSSGNRIDNDGIFTYSSLTLYPAGKGFLSTHKDALTTAHPIVHLKCILQSSSKDREGFHIVNNRGQRVWPEARMEPGDLLLFDGGNMHGVSPSSVDRIALFPISTKAYYPRRFIPSSLDVNDTLPRRIFSRLFTTAC